MNKMKLKGKREKVGKNNRKTRTNTIKVGEERNEGITKRKETEQEGESEGTEGDKWNSVTGREGSLDGDDEMQEKEKGRKDGRKKKETEEEEEESEGKGGKMEVVNAKRRMEKRRRMRREERRIRKEEE